MTESFSISTNVLIERLKDLEGKSLGYRPQTAIILDKIGKILKSWVTNFKITQSKKSFKLKQHL